MFRDGKVIFDQSLFSVSVTSYCIDIYFFFLATKRYYTASIRVYVCVRVRACVRACGCVRACVGACMCVCMCVRACVCM